MNMPVLVTLIAQLDSLLDCDSETLSNATNKHDWKDTRDIFDM